MTLSNSRDTLSVPLDFLRRNRMVARALKLIRQYHEISVNELSEYLLLSTQQIEKLERGQKVPTKQELKLYSEHFDIPLASLLFLSEALRGGETVKSRLRKKLTDKCVDVLDWMVSKKDRSGLQA